MNVDIVKCTIVGKSIEWKQQLLRVKLKDYTKKKMNILIYCSSALVPNMMDTRIIQELVNIPGPH